MLLFHLCRIKLKKKKKKRYRSFVLFCCDFFFCFFFLIYAVLIWSQSQTPNALAFSRSQYSSLDDVLVSVGAASTTTLATWHLEWQCRAAIWSEVRDGTYAKLKIMRCDEQDTKRRV